MLKLRSLGLNDDSVLERQQRIRFADEHMPGAVRLRNAKPATICDAIRAVTHRDGETSHQNS